MSLNDGHILDLKHPHVPLISGLAMSVNPDTIPVLNGDILGYRDFLAIRSTAHAYIVISGIQIWVLKRPENFGLKHIDVV